MIAGLRGKLESLGSEWAIVNVGGIAFQVYMPTSTLSALGAIGEEVHLHTHLHLREDNVTLFGFASPDELALFQTLIGVSGLGPKLALAMLSAMSVEKLTMAIATGSTDLLGIIPGIGKKTANRIILELKDKIGAGWITTPATQLAEENTDVVAALTGLGYSVSEANRVVATLPPSSDLTVEEKIKLALQYFGSK
jgi:Holliday junction DNA helicase RuvA